MYGCTPRYSIDDIVGKLIGWACLQILTVALQMCICLAFALQTVLAQIRDAGQLSPCSHSFKSRPSHQIDRALIQSRLPTKLDVPRISILSFIDQCWLPSQLQCLPGDRRKEAETKTMLKIKTTAQTSLPKKDKAQECLGPHSRNKKKATKFASDTDVSIDHLLQQRGKAAGLEVLQRHFVFGEKGSRL